MCDERCAGRPARAPGRAPAPRPRPRAPARPRPPRTRVEDTGRQGRRRRGGRRQDQESASERAAAKRGLFRSTARMPWQEAARRQKMSADGGRHTRTRFRHTVDGTHEDRGTHARHTDTLRPYKQKHKALVAPLSRYRSHARVSGRVSQYQSQAALDLAITSRTASIATRRWRRCHQARTP